MGLKQVIAGLLAGLAVAGSAGAQQVGDESTRKVSNGLEAYYKAHPEMRPQNLHIGDGPAMAKAKADGLCARPVYPKASLRAEQQGRVDLEFLIDIDGTVADSRVTRSSGFPALDAAAKEGLAKCRFKPASAEGKPARAWQSVTYIWTIN